ncbi:MAG TPA: methyltransferase domain-containing protein [Longimicrobiales bacterium]
MRRGPWSAAAPRVYDALMAPIEALGMRRMRGALWSRVAEGGAGLEIGAGSGASTTARVGGARVVGTDLSPQMLARARARGARHPLVAADVQALPFRDGAFDWVVASLLFCEVPDPPRGLAEVHRVLRPGGSLHLLEHVRPDGMLGALASAATRVTAPLFGEHFDRRTVDDVARAGFAIERLERRLHGGIVLLVARRLNPSEAER